MQDQLEEKYKQTLRAARDKIKELQSALAKQPEPGGAVAVIGMACRFPGGATDPEAFGHLLAVGTQTTTRVPLDRWDMTPWYNPRRGETGKSYTECGAFLTEDPYLFDAAFFGITPAEAESMDPQQRLLLEVSWHAFEDAGINPDHLRGSDTGVFIGISSIDYLQAKMYAPSPEGIDSYATTGAMACSAAGRLSYFYDLYGPSVSTDTACSSSLIAIHNAVEAIREGSCTHALCGGVNLMLSPIAHVGLSAIGALAPDGRCKSFSDQSDGFGRGEGCGVLLLKRLDHAIRDRNTIHALILGGAIGHGGQANGFTAPNGPGQSRIIRRALSDARITPEEVGLIEAHGTGTPLGDPIELEALRDVFANRTTPLMITAVKPNIGHLEAAAGVAGVIKAILAVRDGIIPPTLATTPRSTRVDWSELPLEIIDEGREWSSAGHPRIAGISSFGISGTGAHILVGEFRPETATAEVMTDQSASEEKPCFLLPISGRSSSALQENARNLCSFLNSRNTPLRLVCHEAAQARAHHPHRAAVSGRSAEELLRGLSALGENKSAQTVATGQAGSPDVRPTFLFAGQGSQNPEMGRILYNHFPAFREVLDRCEVAAEKHSHFSLRQMMFAGAETSQLQETRFTQPAIFAYQVALAELWRSIGITPGRLIGHSIGEYAAACVAGVFTLETGLELVLERARLVESFSEEGTMAALFLSEEECGRLLPNGKGIEIAAVNSPDQTVVSGPRKAMEDLLDGCKTKGIRARVLKVSHAFHASTLDPVLPRFKEVLSRIEFLAPRIPLLSTRTCTALTRETRWPEYFCNQMRKSVRFDQAFTQAYKEGDRIFLEIASTPVLTGILNRHPEKPLVIASSGPDAGLALCHAAGILHCAGLPLHWEVLNGEVSSKGTSPGLRSLIPLYSFQRQRFRAPELSVKAQTSTSQEPDSITAIQDLIPVQLSAMQDLIQRQLLALRR